MVQLGSFIGSFTGTAVVTLASATLAIWIWWIIRKKKDRLWFPMSRLVKQEFFPLPKIQYAQPPWIPFLSFVVLAIILLLTTLRPHKVRFIPKDNDQPKVLVLFDLSPSVSARTSQGDLQSLAKSLLPDLMTNAQVSVTTTRLDDLKIINTGEEVAAFSESLQFHTAGIRLGTALNKLMKQAPDMDRVVIVSDNDLHSWSDLNWRGLQESIDVAWVSVGSLSTTEANLFINQVRYVSPPGSSTVEVDLEIARGVSQSGPSDASVEVWFNNKMLVMLPVQIPAQKDRINVRAQWSSDVHTQKDAKNASDDYLEFRVIYGKDLLSMDNIFRSHLFGRQFSAFMVGPTFGERFLDDPTFLLQKALSVLGADLERIDRLDSAPHPTNFWLLIGGSGLGVEQFCPKTPVAPRLANQDDAQGKVWLIPAGASPDYEELCWCFSRFALKDPAYAASMPTFCKEVNTREQYSHLLASLGAKQIGGDIGISDGAVAYRTIGKNNEWDVIALTTPLSPRPGEGLGVMSLPLLTRALLEIQHIAPSSKANEPYGEWPRIVDLATTAQLNRAGISNVPATESFLRQMPSDKMPHTWSRLQTQSHTSAIVHKRESDAAPWVRLMLLGLFAAVSSECLARLIRFFNIRRRVLLLLLMGAFAKKESDLHAADVQLQTIGYGFGSQASTSKLADHVEGRTSISFDARVAELPSFNQMAEEQGWIWVRQAQLIRDANQFLSPRVMTWLRRGGFLVIEENLNEAQLKKLTALFTGLRKNEGWKVIPPDHELMRSFHLLDVLPSCANHIWRGFQVDERIAIMAIPYNFLATLLDKPQQPTCLIKASQEQSVRAFINLLMMVLATDYKRDQIHLPEILKRLR